MSGDRESLFSADVSQEFIRFDQECRDFLESLDCGTAGMATSASWLCPVCNYAGSAHSARCFVAKLILEIGKVGSVGRWVGAVEREMRGHITPEELAARGWEGRSRCRCATAEGYVACPPNMCDSQSLLIELAHAKHQGGIVTKPMEWAREQERERMAERAVRVAEIRQENKGGDASYADIEWLCREVIELQEALSYVRGWQATEAVSE